MNLKILTGQKREAKNNNKKTCRRKHYHKLPIGSLYGIFTYMYHQNQRHVGEYTIRDPMGYRTFLANWVQETATHTAPKHTRALCGRSSRWDITSSGMTWHSLGERASHQPVPSWWLNQPIWKICERQIGSSPQKSGWKYKIFETTT